MPPPAFVALETTLLLHGVPPEAAKPLAARLSKIIRDHGGIPRLVGVVRGQPIVGMSDEQLDTLLAARDSGGGVGGVEKTNTANLGIAMFRARHAATTVSTTMELAARAGISVFATGGIGGVHKFLPRNTPGAVVEPLWAPPRDGAKTAADAKPSTTAPTANPFDISADLTALTRFPIAVVASGVKSILDVAATRELLETLGVPVIGFRTDVFPAFYLRESTTGLPARDSVPSSATGLPARDPVASSATGLPARESVGKVDARFDDPAELARFVRFELARTTRAILICNPIPAEHELKIDDWNRWLAGAQARVAASPATGRDATPALLAALHDISGGATLRANIELVCSNAALAAQVAAAMSRD